MGVTYLGLGIEAGEGTVVEGWTEGCCYDGSFSQLFLPGLEIISIYWERGKRGWTYEFGTEHLFPAFFFAFGG